ncbi:HNH endonuclease [Pantoea eucalypti]|uniref:HNH endonuclease n=1 Tax=Pantoea eucalypti TaxID=470933 RepID=UPI00099AA691|nr:HNH endonuclease [Pantoea eucalypti]SJZ36281.1 5-methylcytosine-specific restriction enzyme A [Pantoea eucalypti]
MNRKQFIQSNGATCSNWTWSWSFVDHTNKKVIFGAWDVEIEQERAVILRERWEFNSNNKKQPGYIQALEHIQMAHEGYELFTFNMVFAEHPDNPEVAVIKDFETLFEEGGAIWYADFLPSPFPDEIPAPESYVEGAKKQVTVNSYERDPKARQACIDHHGTSCGCCGFDFEKVYGEHGKGFIHVHHKTPLHEVGEEYEVNPITDLVPLCPNCHAMVHRGSKVLSVEKLQEKLAKSK